MKWQRLFPVVLLFSCVDGFIANLYYPALLPLLYRDFFVLGVYSLFFLQEPAGRWTSGLRERVGGSAWVFALGYLCVGIAQIFNPSVPSLNVGLLGFKVSYFYWMLAILAYAYAVDLSRARSLLRWVSLFSVPINLFGLYQFYRGPDYLVDAFGPGFERAAILSHIEEGWDPESGFLRIIGTFASSGQFTQFLVVNSAIGFALLLTSRNVRSRSFYVGALMLNFVALLATGSRGGLLILVLSAMAMLVFCTGIRRRAWIGALVVLGVYAGFHWLGESVVQRFETIREIDLVANRTIETTPVMFMELFQEAPFGQGMGIGTGASRYLLGIDSTEWRLIENHLSKLQLETGILGVVFFYLFIGTLMRRWFSSWKPSRDDSVLRNFVGPLSAYCFTFMALSFVIGGFDSPPQSLFLWTLVGLVARLTESSAGAVG